MENSERWKWFLWRRVTAYAVSGGLLTGVAGALLVAPLVGFWWYPLDKEFSFAFSLGDFVGYQGIMAGLKVAGGLGAALGGLFFAGVGFFSRPNRRVTAPPPLVLPTLVGMLLGTVLAAIGLVVFVGIAKDKSPLQIHLIQVWPQMQLLPGYFYMTAKSWFASILYGSTAFMVCGGAVGAWWGLKHWKKAGDNA